MRINLILLLFTISGFYSCIKESPAGPQSNIRSTIFNVNANDWQYDSVSAYLEKPISDITSDVYDNGSVNVYWQINNNWVALPFSYPSDSTLYSMGYSYKTGSLEIFVTTGSGTKPKQLNTATFKAVVTAGN